MKIIPLLPHFQAALNLSAICLLSLAWVNIRRNERSMHRKYMLLALTVSGVFMISYLTYHNQVGYAPFTGQGAIRPIYFTILASHIILAGLIVPLVLTTVILALKGNFPRHRRWARYTFPLWMYVSVSGIIVYVMAFHIYPPQMHLS